MSITDLPCLDVPAYPSVATYGTTKRNSVMLIKTKRFEVEYNRGCSLFIRVELKWGRWETFRDWSGNPCDLSTRSWTPRERILPNRLIRP